MDFAEEIDLSIIIPAYNVEKYIEDCINSIKMQKLHKYEVIIIDDGSSDKTVEKIIGMVNGDKRFKLLFQKNSGQSVARNVGISLAKGEYILFLDADDMLESESLDNVLRKARERNVDMIHYNAQIFSEESFEKNLVDSNYVRNIPVQCNNIFQEMLQTGQFRCPVWLYLIRRSFIENFNLTFLEGIIHEDESFSMIACALTSNALFFEKNLVRHRIRRNSTMTNEKGMYNIASYMAVFVHLSQWHKRNKNKINVSESLFKKRISMFYLYSLRLSLRINKLNAFRVIAIRHVYYIFNYAPFKGAIAIFLPVKIANFLSK